MEDNMEDNADKIIAKAIEIYNREGGKEGTFEMLTYQMSHRYCLRAVKELGIDNSNNED